MRKMSIKVLLTTIHVLTSITEGIAYYTQASSLGDDNTPPFFNGTVCFGSGLEFALRHKDCKQVINLELKDIGQNCTDPCYYGLLPTGSDCQHEDKNSTIHNIEIKFSVDTKRMIHYHELCKRKEVADCTYDFLLICKKSIVNENSDLDSVCLNNSHCSSKHHLNCFRSNKTLDMREYGFCKCAHGYAEWKGKCLKENLILGRFCRHSIQCKGHELSAVCLKDSAGRKRCQCKPDYVKIKKKCVEANLTLHATCQHDAQCADQKSVIACRNDSVGRKRCLCTDRYLEYKNNCIKTERKVNQSCTHESQCNGTVNANVCFRNRCWCNFGYVQSKERCVKYIQILQRSQDQEQQVLMTSASEMFHLAVASSGGLLIGIILSALVTCKVMKRRTRKYSKRKRTLSNNSNGLLSSRNYSPPSTEMEIYNSIEEYPCLEDKSNDKDEDQQQASLDKGKGTFNPSTDKEEEAFENRVQLEPPYDATTVVVLTSESAASKTVEKNDYFTLEKIEC